MANPRARALAAFFLGVLVPAAPLSFAQTPGGPVPPGSRFVPDPSGGPGAGYWVLPNPNGGDSYIYQRGGGQGDSGPKAPARPPLSGNLTKYETWQEWCKDWDEIFASVLRKTAKRVNWAGPSAAVARYGMKSGFWCEFIWEADQSGGPLRITTWQTTSLDQSETGLAESYCQDARNQIVQQISAHFPKYSKYPTWSQEGLYSFHVPNAPKWACVYPRNDDPRTYAQQYQNGSP